MKKYFLSTSALASVALISSLASAEVELGGQVEFNLNSGSTHAGQALEIYAADLFVSGTTTTDGGLEVTGKFNLEHGNGAVDEDGDVSGATSSDDVELLISGGFGTIKLHDADEHAGAAGSLGIYAGSIAAGTGGIDGNSALTWGSGTPTFAGPSGPTLMGLSAGNRLGGVGIYPGYATGPGITYLSNNLSGLTFGLTSYFEEGIFIGPLSNSPTTITGQEAALAYDVAIGSSSLGFSYTSAERTTKTYFNGFGDESDTQEITDSQSSYGLIYSIAGVSFAYGVLDVEGTDRGVRGVVGVESSSTHLGLAYNFGPGNVSYSSVSTTYTLVGVDLDDRAEASVISADYSIGEGITLTADLVDSTTIRVTNVVVGQAEFEDDEFILGISLNF